MNARRLPQMSGALVVVWTDWRDTTCPGCPRRTASASTGRLGTAAPATGEFTPGECPRAKTEGPGGGRLAADPVSAENRSDPLEVFEVRPLGFLRPNESHFWRRLDG